MQEQLPLREKERENWDYFLSLPELDRTKVNMTKVKDSTIFRTAFLNFPVLVPVAVKHRM